MSIPIMGAGQSSAAQMRGFLTAAKVDPDQVVAAYLAVGASEGVSPDGAFAQMCHETGFLTFGGDVQPGQNNFCGLGATGGGNPGLSFPTIEAGVRAHLRHLHAYATTDVLPADGADPRGLPAALRGTAKTFHDLGSKWAPAPDYGDKVEALLVQIRMTTTAAPAAPAALPPLGTGTGDWGTIWEPASLGNYDTNRLPIDLILLHHTACPLAAALARFETPGAQVSAHFVVGQDGTITETVAIGSTAYHSGRYDINERSVGIEHESGPVGQDFFTEIQYQATIQLCAHIGEYFGFALDANSIWPHNRVVPTACPGVLDYSRILRGVQGGIHTAMSAALRNSQTESVTFGAVYLIDAAGKRHVGAPEWADLVKAGMAYTDSDEATLAAIPDAGGAFDIAPVLASIADLKAHPAVVTAVADPEVKAILQRLEGAFRAA